MKKCVNKEIGDLIAAYELNQLEDSERERFEEHLEECEFCRESLIEMAPVLMDMKNKEGLFSEWDGASFDQLAKELIKENNKSSLLDQLKKVINIKNEFLDWLTFEPLLIPEPVLRGEVKDKELVNLKRDWITSYKKKNYKIAIRYLKKINKKQPNQWETLLFLGVCSFLDHQPKPAVKALRRADELSVLSMKEEIRWYLAQSLLLKDEKEEAVRLLVWLQAQPGKIYPKKAKQLLLLLDGD